MVRVTIAGWPGADVKDTGAVCIRRYAKIAGVAEIDSKLDAVIAQGLGPVIGELELILVFNQGAVAVGKAKTLTKDGGGASVSVGARIVQLEARRATGEDVASVQARGSQVAWRS